MGGVFSVRRGTGIGFRRALYGRIVVGMVRRFGPALDCGSRRLGDGGFVQAAESPLRFLLVAAHGKFGEEGAIEHIFRVRNEQLGLCSAGGGKR